MGKASRAGVGSACLHLSKHDKDGTTHHHVIRVSAVLKCCAFFARNDIAQGELTSLKENVASRTMKRLARSSEPDLSSAKMDKLDKEALRFILGD